MIFKDYYKILELETSKVTIDEIKMSYRKVAKKYHPDVNVGDNLAEEKIKDINEAYRVLANQYTKRKYDRMWNSYARKKKKAFNEGNRQSNSIFSEFFYLFFGNTQEEQTDDKKSVPLKGENIETAINIEISEAYFGTQKNISLKNLERKNKNIQYFCTRRN